MKMVAAAKYSRAERELKPARVYGGGALGKEPNWVVKFQIKALNAIPQR